MPALLYATNKFPGDGVTEQFEFAFSGGYMAKADVKAYIEDQTTFARTEVTVTEAMFVNATTLDLGVSAPVGSSMVIYRDTPKTGPLVDFVGGSRITESNLDKVATQAVFIGAETADATNADAVAQIALSAGAAATSAAAALVSQNAAAASATTASGAATSATASATAADVSADAALVSETNADTSEANAAASASAASTSATNSSNSASASAASAAAALTSETNADTSEANAATSATNAANSATAAAASYDSFDDRYLGPKAVAPTLDNDGNALLTGALYFDTVIGGGNMRVWDGAAWDNLPATSAAGVSSTPAGNLAATDVQAALNELDTEKASVDVAPAGEIRFFPATAAPTGFLKANGALLSRTTYAALYAFALASGNISANDGAWLSGGFSPGDGSTTFRIPDLRGYHVRSWDDGRGIDSGRAIGTVQADQLLAHGHTVTDAGHKHEVRLAVTAGTSTNTLATNRGDGNNNNGFMRTDGDALVGANVTVNTSSGGAETRVKTLAILACIKY